jgi:cyclophilin family peptidyl-prolyl cis-trans isomerase
MGVADRDYTKTAEPEAPAPASGWLARLNEYGEKHATPIITVSTVLIILTVILFAKVRYDIAQREAAERDLAEAETVTRLLELKAKYAGTPVAPRILYRLAGKYADEGKIDVALNEYEEFKSRYPGDSLADAVSGAIVRLKANLKYEQERKEMRLKEHKLQSHPRQFPDLKDPRLEWGPVRLKNPLAELDAGTGVVKIELDEDAAPNAVAHFVRLCEEKHFDGAKLDLLNGDERLDAQRADKPLDYTLPYEKTEREPEAFTLVLVRKEGAEENLAGRFQLLLKRPEGLKDVTVFGKVLDGSPFLSKVKKDDPIKSLKITEKRSHSYEVKQIKKP